MIRAFAVCLCLLSLCASDLFAQRGRVVRTCNSGPCFVEQVAVAVPVVPVVPVVPAIVYPQAPSYGPEWKTEAIKFAELQADHAAYLATMKALGVNGQGYGLQNSFAYGTQALFGANASTNYGYSYNTLAQLYGDTNLSQLYQQSAQLTAGAQRLAGDAHQGHQLLVGQEGLNRAKIAEILAKGQSAEQILRALNGPNTVQTQTTVIGSNTSPQGPPPNVATLPPPKFRTAERPGFAALQALIGARCASCHSGMNKKGGVDLADYPNFTPDQKQRVLAAITSADPKTAMPRNADGSPGARLTPAEMQLFFAN